MTHRFQSILFHEPEVVANVNDQPMPDFFVDLNLDQAVASLTAARDEYNLKPFFYIPLKDVQAVRYRHEVFRDLEDEALRGHIQSFAQSMREMRAHLAQIEKLHYERQKQSWFLDAVHLYCGAVQRLDHALAVTNPRSQGFAAFREFLANYIESEGFMALSRETEKLKSDLSAIRYRLFIEGKRIHIDRYDPEPDYGATVLQAFVKFKQAEAKSYRFGFSSDPDMNHVEAEILDRVAKRYPDIFSSLENYVARHRGYLDSTIAAFDREVQFYIACLEHVNRFKEAGLQVCYPTVTDQSKEVYGREAFDIALADRLIREMGKIVPNDFYLRGQERIIVVTGPNQGGKTTFARMFGQLHYWAAIGCPVPGREAKLFLFDQLFTHFEREEDIRELGSKLEMDLIRIHRILERATPKSILVMNESFLSTTLNDALFLSTEVMRQIIERDMLCVSVTFLDELASMSEKTVSMVSTVDPKDPALRTFKIIRKPADGLAYAVAIAEKYRLTYQSAKERLAS